MERHDSRGRPTRRGLLSPLPIAGVAVVSFLTLAVAVLYNFTTGFDGYIREFVHERVSWQRARAMLGVSLLGSKDALVPAVLLIIVFLLWRGLRRDALLLALVMGGEVILENALKEIFNRPRPATFFNLAAPASYAFPSGHALASCCFYGAVALIFSRHLESRISRAAVWVLAVLMAGAIGFSRIYLGVHYPTDVIGGYLMGITWVLAANRLVRRRLPTVVEAQ